jgi:hypothetical protein
MIAYEMQDENVELDVNDMNEDDFEEIKND